MSKTPVVELDPTTFDGPDDIDDAQLAATVRIRGRNVQVPDHFVDRIHSKLAPVEKMNPDTITRFDVVLLHEKNPRHGDTRQRIEITVRSKSGVARAEAAEDSFYSALDAAVSKLMRQIRKARTRKKISHSGHRKPTSVAAATAELSEMSAPIETLDEYASEGEDDHGPGRIVRRKSYNSDPITVDEALSQMELVGHDFYLFRDAETGVPSVVYRRHAFDYGIISLVDSNELSTSSDERDDSAILD
ncbi:ribosome hibernation-promoting factor, HPF/YfiA family [Dietzia sp.]|uniref:ribosome hibernation-promoting factor, HPF/YfiA family n=1 Tax=Dietzia sp. TaxID=1871616 RepID=UPI002FDA23E1